MDAGRETVQPLPRGIWVIIPDTRAPALPIDLAGISQLAPFLPLNRGRSSSGGLSAPVHDLKANLVAFKMRKII